MPYFHIHLWLFLEKVVVDCGYFWKPLLSSSEHPPTQLSFSKWCQDGQDPADAVRVRLTDQTCGEAREIRRLFSNLI